MLTYLCGIGWNPYGIINMEYNGIHLISSGIWWNTMIPYQYSTGIQVEWNWIIWIPCGIQWFHGMWWIPFHSIPPGFQWNIHMEFQYSIAIPYGMNVEKCTKMSGTSAKFIPYGIDTNSIWIPLECGGTVKTSHLASLVVSPCHLLLDSDCRPLAPLFVTPLHSSSAPSDQCHVSLQHLLYYHLHTVAYAYQLPCSLGGRWTVGLAFLYIVGMGTSGLSLFSSTAFHCSI